MRICVPELFMRADADTRMGTGHVMRCLALAQAWREKGGSATFLASGLSDGLRQRLHDKEVPVIAIESVYPGVRDIEQTLEISTPGREAWLVLDGYHFDLAYQQAVRSAGVKLLVVDDGMYTDHCYDADILLNQNLGAERLLYTCAPDTRCLLGSRYILLRQEFHRTGIQKVQVTEKACRVLVTLGGGDPDNQTLKVIQALKAVNVLGLEGRVVVGPSNPHMNLLKTAVADTPADIYLLRDVSDMSALMAWADVAVSAGGSTCWELAFIGVPNLIIVTADNQLGIARALHTAGISENLGWFEDITVERLIEALAALLGNRRRREEMCRRGQAVIDGQGALRVVETMRGAA